MHATMHLPLASLAALAVALGCVTAQSRGPSPEPSAWRRPGALLAPDAPEHAEAVASLAVEVRASRLNQIPELLDDALDAGARFTARDVGRLVEAVSFFDERLAVVELLRHRIIDPENGYDVVRQFPFESERQEAAPLLLTLGALGRPHHSPDRAACEALASGTPDAAKGRPGFAGCTVAHVLELFDGEYWTTEKRFELLRRTGPFIVDRHEAYRLVQELPFDDDRRRAWRLLF